MTTNHKIPKWVRDLPDDSPDKTLLIKIVESTKRHLNDKWQITFSLKSISDKSLAQNICTEYLEKNGWQCQIEQDSASDKCWIEATKSDYMIDEHPFMDDVALFERLASLYKIAFDGWYIKL